MKASTLTIERVDAPGWEETAGVLEAVQEHETGAAYGALLSGVADGAGAALGGSYGSIVQGAGRVLGGLLDGKAQNGASTGKALGGLAGSALGTALGGPVGGALAGAAGDVIGGLIGGAVDNARKKPANKNARKAARAKAQAKTQARLARLEASQGAQAKPAEPPRELVAQPRPAVASKGDTAPAAVTSNGDVPPAVAAPARLQIPPTPATNAAPEYPAELRDFRATLSRENAERLDQAVRERRGLEVLREILAERRAIDAMEAEVAEQKRQRDQRDREQLAREAAEQAAQLAREQAEREQLAREERETAAPAPAPQPAREQPPQREGENATDTRCIRGPAPASVHAEQADTRGDYDDTAAPPAKRPQPRRHLGLIPMKQHQLEALLVKVPALRRLDTRLLRLMSGRGSTVRDTAGIDPSARAYVALPGETAAGIAKKLTGREERAADLLAANPARREGEPWRIPPGWMHFVATDTGEASEESADTSGTSRSYIVQAGDTPVGVAQKSGAKAVRPRWWAELKAANPQIPTTDDGKNFERFFAGQQLWIPEEWPASPMFQPAAGVAPKPPANVPQVPGLPGLPAIPGLNVPQIPGLNVPGTTPGTTPPNTTIDPGVPLQAQAMLAYWAASHPNACNPADYGSNVADLTGTTSTRFVLALTSFQTWHNARNPAAPLRVDGVLDGTTYQALYAATLGAVPAPGPGAVPWPKPNPQQPQNNPPAAPNGLPGILGGLLGGANGLPGINGGLPQLGGPGVPGANNVPIPGPRSSSAPLPPGAVPGFHVAGQPPNVVWDFDGTMISLPPGFQPLDTIYGTPPPDFVWQGGSSMPGPQNLPWVQQPANQVPLPSLPWPWNPGNGSPAPTQPATQPQAQSAPAKDDGALPIAGLLAALAFVS